MSFYIGRMRPFRRSEVKHMTNIRDLRTVTQGDIVDTFGHVFQWDQDCVPVELCESWCQMGDPVCDNALREAFTHPSVSVGKDLLAALEEHAASAYDDAPASKAFLDEVHQAPPAGILATGEEIRIAQELFIDDSIQILQALLHYSLAGGLASSRIVRTLEAVSYLLPHVSKGTNRVHTSVHDVVSQISKESSDRTFMRLLETMQFILDVMGCSASASSEPADESSTHAKGDAELASLVPGGEGWRSAIRVRLLHGIARWRVQTRWEKEHPSEARGSVPLSQEEIAATLGAFSTIPIWCLHRLHVPPSPAQANAYIALWRHIGFYMGVSPSILLRYFSTSNAADKFITTAAFNLFLEEYPAEPEPPGGASSLLRHPTIPILVAISNRPPLHTSVEYNIALTTYLIGQPLAAHLNLPQTSTWTRAKMHTSLLVQRVPHYFARWYPRKGWAEKRREALRGGMLLTVHSDMGMRRTTFRPRTINDNVEQEPDGGVKVSTRGGELAPGVAEAEGVRGNQARLSELTRMWKEVFLEMVGVCIMTCLAGGVLGYMGLAFALQHCRWL